MKKKEESHYCQDLDWFYRKYAHQNQIDYGELCLLDILHQAGGIMTWKAILTTLPSSNVTIRQTAFDLMDQGLVLCQADSVSLTEYGQFAIYDVLYDLHSKMDEFLEFEDPIPNLCA